MRPRGPNEIKQNDVTEEGHVHSIVDLIFWVRWSILHYHSAVVLELGKDQCERRAVRACGLPGI